MQNHLCKWVFKEYCKLVEFTSENFSKWFATLFLLTLSHGSLTTLPPRCRVLSPREVENYLTYVYAAENCEGLR